MFKCSMNVGGCKQLVIQYLLCQELNAALRLGSIFVGCSDILLVLLRRRSADQRIDQKKLFHVKQIKNGLQKQPVN